jgi:chromosome segregation protein
MQKEKILETLDSDKVNANSLTKEIDSIKQVINEINQNINHNKNRIAEINFKKNRHKENLDRVIKSISELSKKLEEQKVRYSEIETKSQKQNNELETLQNKKIDIEKIIELNTNKINSLKDNITNLKNELNDKRLEFKELSRELIFWESSIDKSSNAGFLLSNKNWNKNFSTLAENLGIDEKYIHAYGAVLNYKSDSILIGDLDKALEAGELLRSNKKGKHSFIITNDIPFTEQIEKPEKALAIFSELPRVNDDIRNYLKKAFSDIIIVETFDDAIELIKSPKVNAAVTLSGNIISKNGEITIGGNEKSKADFGKKEKIERLQKSIKTIQNVIKDQELEISNIEEELKSIELTKYKDDLNNINSNINNLNKNISQSQVERNSIQNRLDLFTENLKNAENEKEELDQKEISDTEIADIEDANHELQGKENEKNSELKITEEKLNEINKKIQEINIENVNISNKINNLENEKRNIQNSIDASKRRILKAERDFEKNKIELERVLNDAKIASENIIIFKKELEQKKTESEVLIEKIKDISKEIESIDSTKTIIQKDLDRFISQHHKIEIELTEVKTKIESILQNANEKYELSLESLQKIEAEIEPDELRSSIKELKEKLSSIGSVNFMALEDFEKENQRLIFYETQIEDLTKAKTTLLETIKEINKKAEELLTNTFEQVRTNFKELFQTLFNEEGECDIMLEGDNPLDADLEIMAKPPGKKPHSIDMLSGGEKTLTAIALLFAIYLVKPSPFCILDEVDAPLDDNNIGRYVKLIKKFSNNTQFLVVTHNKKTMEAADNLYGITQQEEGLSKIVSVQLNRNI